MRIGVLTTSYPRFAGDPAGGFVEGFASALRDRGHAIEVLAPEPREGSGPQPLAPRWVRYLPPPLERTFHGAGVPDNLRCDPLAWPGALTYPVALWRAASRHAPRWDAVVSHFGLPCGPIGEAVANGRPHLCVWHSADVHLQASLPRATRRWMRRPGLVHWTVTDAARERLGLPDAIVSPMGASPTAAVDRMAARRELGVSGLTLGFLGRLVPIKGVDRLIDACAGSRVTLLVGGDGPERGRLERRAAQVGARCHFLGVVHDRRKALLLAAADAFAFPSRVIAGRTEGAPVALMEARLAQRPVIASGTGGLVERIRHEVDGLLVWDDDVRGDGQAWRDAIERLRDPALRARLATAGAARDRHLMWPALGALAEDALQGWTRRVPAGGR